MSRSGKRLVSILCVLALVVGMVPAALAVEEVAEEISEAQVGTMPALDEEVPETPVADADEPAALLDGCTCSPSEPHTAGYVMKYPSQGTVHYYAIAKNDIIALQTDGGEPVSNEGKDTNFFSNDSDGTDNTNGKLSFKLSKQDKYGESWIEFKFDGASEKTKITVHVVDPTACVHKWGEGEVTKQPTCTEKGTQTYTCSECGETKTEDVAALGHDFTVDVAAVPASCYQAGSTAGKKCSRCDATDGVTVVNATGAHSYDTTTGKCTTPGCTAVDPGSCPHTNKVTVERQEATCTKPGVVGGEYCQDCGKDRAAAEQTIPATGHTDADNDGKCDTCGNEMSTTLTGAGGWFETLYVETSQFTPNQVTAVSWSGPMIGRLAGEDKQYLVRSNGKGGTRIDIPGVLAGENYTLKVTANGTIYEANGITVQEHDRSGYAHYNYTAGVGAYRDDGILKEDAIVLYVTEENKNTVTLEAPDGTVVTGIGNILNTNGKDTGGGTNAKGGKANTNGDILRKLADANIPLVVRIVGSVKSSHPNPTIDGLSAYDSVDYGGSTGDNGNMARMKAIKNITIEGIGTDACIDGWGLHFISGSDDPAAGRGIGFEVRNVAFRNVPEDCIGFEGQYENKVLYPVQRCWVHNCAFYAPSISPCAESDKDGGDGACDFKRGEYMTMDYCYFESYHKTNLVGSGDSDAAGPQYHITWHHNYYKNCDSRGPLARKANMHIYNCIWEGQTSYVMDPRVDTYIFSEYNTFLNCKDPMRTGAIKSYNDVFTSCNGEPHATIVTDKNQAVNSANAYANFDTNESICYIPAGAYDIDKDVSVARAKIKASCGAMGQELTLEEETVDTDRTPSGFVTLPYDQAINSGYVSQTKTKVEKDNIIFYVSKTAADSLTIGGSDGANIGQSIVFKVNEAVDITVTDGGASYPVALMNAAGATLLTGSGTASKCPAGTYIIQSSNYQSGSYKEAKISHLKIVKAADQTPEHTHSFGSYTQTVAPTCTKAGVAQAECSCGETDTKVVEKVEHNYNNGACIWCGLADGVVNGDPDAPEVNVTAVAITSDATQNPIPLLQEAAIQLTATVTPANATDRSVSWESSNTAVATVSNRGLVTAKGPGTAVITVTTNDGSFTASVNVSVTGISTSTYTFSAPTAHSDAQTMADQSATEGKYGTSDYFTLTGTKNTWKAQDFKNGKKNTVAIRLAAQEGGALEFTVPADCVSATVTLAFRSTSKDNSSAIGILDASGNLVNTADGNRLATVTGTSNASAKYTLSPGTYKIVSPKDVLPSEVDPDLESFGADGKNDPNTRAVELVSANVVESRTVGEGDIVAVTGLSLDKTTASMETGDILALVATVTPSNATFQTVNWKSSNTSVVTVSQGTVTAWGAGTATITAECGSFSATCTVTVTASTSTETKVQSIKVVGPSGATSTAVTVSSTEQTVELTTQILPADADDARVTWTIVPTGKGVSVSASGVVTVSRDAETGSYTVTATARDGSGVKGTYTLTVTGATQPPAPVAVTGVSLDMNALTLRVGETATLEATVQPANADNTSVTWTSSDSAVASVAGGTVTAVAAGTATITVTTADGGKTDTCAVTVKAAGAAPVTTKKTLDATKDFGNLAGVSKDDPLEKGVNDEVPVTDAEMAALHDGYFTVTGDVNKRVKTTGKDPNKTISDPAVFCVEVKTQEASDIRFTVAQGATAKATVGISSTSGSNWSALELQKKNGESWEAVEATITADSALKYLAGSTKTVVVNNTAEKTVTFTGLEAGEYRVVTPDKGNGVTDAAVSDSAGLWMDIDGNEVTTKPESTANYPFTRNTRIFKVEVEETTVPGGDTEVDVTSVTLNKKNLTLSAEGAASEKLTATVLPADATDATVTWKSSDTAVATVANDGTVTAVAAGTATITAATSNGKKDTCTVTVTGGSVVPDDSWSVTLALTNLQCNNAPETVKKGEKLQLRLDIKTSSYNLPTSITVKMGGVTLSQSQYSYNSNTGLVIINSVTGNVVITAAGSFSGSGNTGGGSHGGAAPSTPTEPTTPATGLAFVDVKNDDWFYSEVKAAVDKGLIKGLDATHFAPEAKTSRAMIATILFRLDGEKATNIQATFNDVASGEWYSEAVEWAADKGIVKGYSDDVFAPNDNITREQLAAMLFRYANPTVLDKSDALGEFNDASNVSDWAVEAMQWCVKMGIITGKGAGVLDPQGMASRAEAVTMLMRFVNLEK